jgi:hypothetical protein
VLCSEIMVAYKWFIVNTDSQRTSPSCSTTYWLADSWNDVWLMRSAAQYCINYFDNHYLTAVLGNDGHASQTHVFWEFAVVFDGEYCTFVRVHNLYSHETSCNVVKKATRCWWLIFIIMSYTQNLCQNGKAHRYTSIIKHHLPCTHWTRPDR